MPLQHRHGYAAGPHRGLPSRRHKPTEESPHTTIAVSVCAATRPQSARFEPLGLLRSFRTLVPHVRLSVSLAGPGPSGSTDPSRRCQGCFPPSPPFQRLRLPSASRARCDGHEAVSSHHRTVRKRLVALYIANPGFIRPSSAEVARQQVRDPMSRGCGGDTPLAGNETRHTMALHQPHPPACGSPPGHADPAQRTPEANHKSPQTGARWPRSRPPAHPLPSAQDPTGVAAWRRNTPTGTPPPPNSQASPGTLRPPQHRRNDTTSPLRLPHPKGHSSSFRAHAPIRSRAFSRTQLPQPLPLPRRQPFPLTPVDPILTHPVPQRRVINTQLVSDLADRLARAANNLHRIHV